MDDPKFVITMADENGHLSRYHYFSHSSRFLHEDGTSAVPADLLAKKQAWHFHPIEAVSPENPGRKINRPCRLKIQLGLGCNYDCSYCLQRAEIAAAEATSTFDATRFMDNLDKWLDGSDLTKIELWGGEPILYWNKIEAMVPRLKDKFPRAKLGMVTNGTLLTPDKVQRLFDWGYSMAISHDGPGQHIRGDDPLAKPHPGIEKAVELFMPAGRMSFNAVLTPASNDIGKTIAWFKAKFGKNCVVNFEGIVHQYSDDPNARFTEDQLREFTARTVDQIMTGEALQTQAVRLKVRSFMDSLIAGQPIETLGQKCGMDRPDQLAVDLNGNVTTCQNVGAKGPHKIGHVMKMDQVRLNTSWHWSNRPECVACPVLKLCAGACMYQDGNQWVDSCNAEFAYNMTFLIAAVSIITKKKFVSLEGNIIRPKYKE